MAADTVLVESPLYPLRGFVSLSNAHVVQPDVQILGCGELDDFNGLLHRFELHVVW